MVAQSHTQPSMLHTAIRNNNLGEARALLQHGADANARQYGTTPLHRAIAANSIDMVRLLLDYNADPTIVNKDGFTPLHSAVGGNRAEITEILLHQGADPNALRHNAESPLHLAAQHGHTGCARLLLDHGADPDALHSECRTPLNIAARYGHVGCAQLLLDHGANPNRYTASWRESPLHSAINYQTRHLMDMVGLLIERGANLRSRNPFGETPMQLAVRTIRPHDVTLPPLPAKHLRERVAVARLLAAHRIQAAWRRTLHLRLRRDFAARVIQRYWVRAYWDPRYRVCQGRLCRDFAALTAAPAPAH